MKDDIGLGDVTIRPEGDESEKVVNSMMVITITRRRLPEARRRRGPFLSVL